MIKEKSKPDTQTRRYGARKFAFGVLLSATRQEAATVFGDP
jgi:hypothetical protein